MILRKDFNSCFRRITNPAEPLGQAGVDFGFGVAGGAIPSASPLIPYQIQMMPSSFMLYGINYGVNTVNFPSK